MNTGKMDRPTTGSGHDSTDQIAQLLRRVEPRPPLSDRRIQRVRAAVHARWSQARQARRRRRGLLLSGGVAAALATAVLLYPTAQSWVTGRLTPPLQGPIGEVAVVRGLVWYATRETPEQFPGRRLRAEDVLEVGTRIETTSEAQVALLLADGRSLRLNRDTRVRFAGSTVFELQRGTIYVDSGLQSALPTAVEIHTALGTVSDIGTQFEVRLLDQALRVRVREGAINLEREGEAFEAAAGTELSIDLAGSVSRRPVPVLGPIWDWVLEIAPPFSLEGSSLPSFLGWVSRETGREIRFADEAIAESAAQITVHGSVDGLRPDLALEAVLPTCGLRHRSDGDFLILDSQPQ